LFRVDHNLYEDENECESSKQRINDCLKRVNVSFSRMYFT